MPETVAAVADARDALLATVDFKWLMTGQGWWVDMARFHTDPSYARDMLRLAMSSSSFALRECAAGLQRYVEHRPAPAESDA
jgi:hypothetical protein